MQLTTEIAMLIASFFAIMTLYAGSRIQQLTKLKDAYKLMYIHAERSSLDVLDDFGPYDSAIQKGLDELGSQIDSMHKIINYKTANKLTKQDMKGL